MEGYKTYTGIAVAVIGVLMQMFKINITTEEIQPIVNSAVELGGLIFAAYGRYKVKK